MHTFIHLASTSPRRRQLLDQLGVRYRLLLPDAHEDAEALEAEQAGEQPAQYVMRVALAKLDAALLRMTRHGADAAPVLASDTTVAVGRRMLAKPADAAQAQQMLQMLSGRTHRVLTAVALQTGDRTLTALSTSKVRFGTLSAQDIVRYIDSGEPFGKAGGYAIQSRIAAFIEHVEGSYSGIMGLPLFETAQLLRQANVQF
jgi:septum formation protein